jgi:hypothetical protein
MSSKDTERNSDNSLERTFAVEGSFDASINAADASKRRRDRAREEKEREAEAKRKEDAIEASLKAGDDSRKKRNK